jgi:dTDP-4-amino-4,6-dideoxygalactose transaminase
VASNRKNYEAYADGLRGLPGISLIVYPAQERVNYQYVVIEVDPEASPLNRDELVAVLHGENVLARKYFWPGCHRMEPYRSLQPNAFLLLPQTDKVAARVIVLPTGQSLSPENAQVVCMLIKTALKKAPQVRSALHALYCHNS